MTLCYPVVNFLEFLGLLQEQRRQEKEGSGREGRRRLVERRRNIYFENRMEFLESKE